MRILLILSFLIAVSDCISQSTGIAVVHQEKFSCRPSAFSVSSERLVVSGPFGTNEKFPSDSAFGGYVATYSHSGELIWGYKFFTDTSVSKRRGLHLVSEVDDAGNVYVGCKRLSKFDPLGNLVFDFALPPYMTIEKLLIDPSGNLVIIGANRPGTIFGTTVLKKDGFLAKIDPYGGIRWCKDFFHQYLIEVALDMDVTADGIFVAGAVGGTAFFVDDKDIQSTSGYDGFVCKLDTGGTLSWVQLISGFANQMPRSISVNSLQEIYVAGSYMSREAVFSNQLILGPDAGYGDAFVAKYDSNGRCLWAKQGGGNKPDDVFDIYAAESGQVFVTGKTWSSEVKFDAFTIPTTGSMITNGFLLELDSVANVSNLYGGGPDYNVAMHAHGISGKDIYLAGSFSGNVTVLGHDLNSNLEATYIVQMPTLFSNLLENSFKRPPTVFPNPTRTNFEINFNETIVLRKIDIISPAGEAVQSIIFPREYRSSSVSLPASNLLPPGLYFIQVETLTETFCSKVVVQ